MVHLLLIVIYLSFVSLGLPDGLLGAAWPTMYIDLGAPVSFAGVISMIISVGTISSSLMSDRLTRRLGAGRVTAFSVALTAAALLGFSASGSAAGLCMWAIPYGLGAGSVDAALNNYVALHYASRHMSWLHCMWGLGATVGPYIMGWFLSGGQGWSAGYRCVGLLQGVLTGVILLSLPLWKGRPRPEEGEREAQALSLREILRIPGAKEVVGAFFCYCALEQTAGLWAGSYLALHRGLSEERAAVFAGLFYIGITVGRALNGFLTMRFSDDRLTGLGQGIIALGVAALLLPVGDWGWLSGLLLVGLGCAPIYPCIIHSTPARFGAHRSQAVIGVQMASAYVGSLVMPPLFGLLADRVGVAMFPGFLLVILAVMVLAHRRLVAVCGG